MKTLLFAKKSRKEESIEVTESFSVNKEKESQELQESSDDLAIVRGVLDGNEEHFLEPKFDTKRQSFSVQNSKSLNTSVVYFNDQNKTRIPIDEPALQTPFRNQNNLHLDNGNGLTQQRNLSSYDLNVRSTRRNSQVRRDDEDPLNNSMSSIGSKPKLRNSNLSKMKKSFSMGGFRKKLSFSKQGSVNNAPPTVSTTKNSEFTLPSQQPRQQRRKSNTRFSFTSQNSMERKHIMQSTYNHRHQHHHHVHQTRNVTGSTSTSIIASSSSQSKNKQSLEVRNSSFTSIDQVEFNKAKQLKEKAKIKLKNAAWREAIQILQNVLMLENEIKKNSKHLYNPLDSSDTLFLIGTGFFSMNLLDSALNAFNESLLIRKRIYGDKHIEVADCFHYIGMISGDLGKYEEAIYNLQQAQRIQLRTLGTEDSNTVNLLNDFQRLRR